MSSSRVSGFYTGSSGLSLKLKKLELHCFFPLVLTKLISIIFYTSLNTFLKKGYLLTNLEESNTREVL
jgi:hypothetical protein